tara:strand:- start:833 stop:1840 length:1008 start_codon:yes stop_codon:yes gene_type:complete
MDNFDTTKWFKNQYIKEHIIIESVSVNLDDLTFDMVKDTFKDQYQNVHFSRKQPNGEEGNYYKDAVSFPNPDDSLSKVGDMSAFEDWKEKTLERYGKVNLLLQPEASVWFDKVKIDDEKFLKDKKGYVDAKGKAMDDWSKKGYSIDEEIDMNDPVLVKARAAQMADEKEIAKQAELDKKYGSNFMDKLDAEINLKQELQDLKDERAQLMIDMEQEAEPEGGEIADDYGSRLNDIDSRRELIQKDIDDLRMYENKEAIKETFRFIKENNPEFTSEEIKAELKEIEKLGNQLNEELCAKGKAYRKRRMAAGEKSSAYLSGRAVKVCKGQMSGKKKKK